jgi:hypothetical protein
LKRTGPDDLEKRKIFSLCLWLPAELGTG